MAEEVVEVAIGPDGKVSIAVDGIAGARCLDETADLLEALGGDVESQEMTAEAYVDEDESVQERQELGW